LPRRDRRPQTRAIALLGAFVLLVYLAVSARGGGAEPRHEGPPLSSPALLSRFARDQGIAPEPFAQLAADLAGGPLGPPEEIAAVEVAAGSLDVRVNQDFSLRPQNETNIAVNPFSPNMLVAGANDYRLGNPIGAAFYASFDNGATWDDGIPPYPLLAVTHGDRAPPQLRFFESPFGAGDPVLAFGRPRAAGFGTPFVVYYAYLAVSASFCEHGLFVSRSSNGLTWTRPVVPPLLPPKGLFTPVYWDSENDCGIFNDKPWLAVDTSGGPHDGRVYLTFTRFEFRNQRFRESPIFMSFSDDNALTWSDPIEVSGSSLTLCRAQVRGKEGRCDESQFSSVVVGPDGTLYIAFVNQQALGAADGFRNQYLVTKVNPDTLQVSGPFRAAGLIDGLDDFPVNTFGQSTLCNSNFRLNSAGNLAMDPRGSALYVVFTDNRNGSSFRSTQVSQDGLFGCPTGTTTDADVFIVKSSDGGVTWSPPLRVNQDPPGNGKDQWFPFAAVAPDGRVDVMFYDRSEDPLNHFAHVHLARSRDGGATWSDSRISDAASNMNWAFENGLFMGDYNGLAIGPDGTSYPFWTDARNGAPPNPPQSDVFMDTVLP